jgi:rRNA small subunit pseudouridine methyltransferase Nep1
MPRNTVRSSPTEGRISKSDDGVCTSPIALTRTGKLVNPWEWVEQLPKDEPVVFIFGAMAHGHIDKENTSYVRSGSVLSDSLIVVFLTSGFSMVQLDEQISISEYPLSGAHAITRLLNAFERNWGIL